MTIPEVTQVGLPILQDLAYSQEQSASAAAQAITADELTERLVPQRISWHKTLNTAGVLLMCGIVAAVITGIVVSVNLMHDPSTDAPPPQPSVPTWTETTPTADPPPPPLVIGPDAIRELSPDDLLVNIITSTEVDHGTVTVDDRSQAIALGHWVCRSLGTQTYTQTVAAGVHGFSTQPRWQALPPNIVADVVRLDVHAAIVAYCPQYESEE